MPNIYGVRGFGSGKAMVEAALVSRGKRGLGRVYLALLVSLGLQAEFQIPATIAYAQSDASVMRGEYIIQRRPIRPGEQRSESVKEYSVKSAAKFFEVVSVGNTTGFGAASSAIVPLDAIQVKRDCALITRDPTVRTCEPNFIRQLYAVPNDTHFSSQWALDNNVNTDINLPEAWNSGTGSKSTLIGVIDSGIYGPHPDLAANLWANPNDPVDGYDNDGNGYVDDVFGVNTHFGSGNPGDCHGHGTHVSGIIGAVGNNSAGVSGINWAASLIVASFAIDCSGGGTLASVIRAYDYFTDLKRRGHNIRLVNASFGGTEFSAAEFSALDRLRAADILLVTAAGNNDADSNRSPVYPANYELSNIINVGATGPTRRRAPYSNFGQTVDIAAPGGDSDYVNGAIYSTWSPIATGGMLYRGIEGTSMAAPMVTGAIGLLASLQPTLTGPALRQMVLSSAFPVRELSTAVSGGRFLDVAALVTSSSPADGCPLDPAKIEPGVCGCGIADTDGNNNKRWDCLEVDVANLVPAKPDLKTVGKKIQIVMQPYSGVEYYVEVSTSSREASRRKVRTSYRVSQARAGTIPKPPKGATLMVRYAFRALGTASDFSYWSQYATLRVNK
jgi:subtilisin family serine protease